MSEPTVPAGTDLRTRARAVLERHWRPEGYAVPNTESYPFLWLWDSCFHAVIWAELGDERAAVELASVFHAQAPSGFVPHVDYRSDPGFLESFWGRRGASSLTQPPMYGHAVAELHRRGVPVDAEVVDRASRGLRFLLASRARLDGLVALCHPWESGADDSPRWDSWCPGGFERERWYRAKGDLLGPVQRGRDGSPVANPAFVVAGAGFNALVAFNCAELAGVTGDERLAAAGREVADALAARWDDGLGVWVDGGDVVERPSSAVRTLDALLPLLVEDRHDRASRVAATLFDPGAHLAPFGPTGVHRAEPTYDPAGYWRGSAWPQVNYLLWLALRRAGVEPAAVDLARMTRAGAGRSGMAEHWHPETGEGLGAVPQSWTGLALLMDDP